MKSSNVRQTMLFGLLLIVASSSSGANADIFVGEWIQCIAADGREMAGHPAIQLKITKTRDVYSVIFYTPEMWSPGDKAGMDFVRRLYGPTYLLSDDGKSIVSINAAGTFKYQSRANMLCESQRLGCFRRRRKGESFGVDARLQSHSAALVVHHLRTQGGTIAVPGDWEIQEDVEIQGNKVALGAVRPLRDGLDTSVTFRENAWLVIEKIAPKTSVNDYINLSLQRLQLAIPSFKQYKIGELKLGSPSAGKFLTYGYIADNMVMEIIVFFYVRGEDGYTLTCTSTEQDFIQYLSLFMGIGRSFKPSGVTGVQGGRTSPRSAVVPQRSPASRGSDGAPMVLIPAGEFTMGSIDYDDDEKPPHRVSISAFYLDKYEVTFDLYDKFCDETGRTKPSDSGWGRGDRPVINVSWDDANAYATHCGKRLPTEAEWEYACRAGSTGKWCFGDDEGQLGEYAWYSANAGSMTHLVGQKAANAWGLYDMYGNVWEWCADWYDSGYYAVSPANNPSGPASGTYRALRGGSWFLRPDGHLRSGYRYRYAPAPGTYIVGCRCARTP